MSFGCPRHLEMYRVNPAQYEQGDSNNGFLIIRHRGLAVIFSNGEGWQHVSVSRKRRVPTYSDMCWVKDQFWTEDECVMQLHVPKSDHINCHPNCLHLWRPLDAEIPRPPPILVGPPR